MVRRDTALISKNIFDLSGLELPLPQTYDVTNYQSYYPTSNPYIPFGHLGEYIAVANVVRCKSRHYSLYYQTITVNIY